MPSLKDVGTNVIANLVAGVVIFVLSAIYAFYSNNPERFLLLVGIALLIANVLLTLRLLVSFKRLQRMFEDFFIQFQHQKILEADEAVLSELKAITNNFPRLRNYFEMTNKEYDEKTKTIMLEFINTAQAPFLSEANNIFRQARWYAGHRYNL